MLAHLAVPRPVGETMFLPEPPDDTDGSDGAGAAWAPVHSIA